MEIYSRENFEYTEIVSAYEACKNDIDSVNKDDFKTTSMWLETFCSYLVDDEEVSIQFFYDISSYSYSYIKIRFFVTSSKEYKLSTYYRVDLICYPNMYDEATLSILGFEVNYSIKTNRQHAFVIVQDLKRNNLKYLKKGLGYAKGTN